jgi:lipopolysaccharide transport system ATP-binding protein
MSSDTSIKVEGLSKRFEIFNQPRDRLKQMVVPRLKRAVGMHPTQYFREFWAVKDVSFTVKRGETVGIIGRNGSGKSTLLQMICGTLTPTSGSIVTNGRVAALLELGSGFNPEFTGRENVFLNASLYGLSNKETAERFDEIARFAEIGAFIDQPVKIYSSGMMVRLAFAVIAHVDADILVVDEALSVGDAIFTQKCMRFIRSFQQKGTLLFVSHDASAVQNLCESAIWLNQGEIRQIGTSKAVSEAYLQYSLQEIYGNDAKLDSLAVGAETVGGSDTSALSEADQLDVKANVRDELPVKPYASSYKFVDNLNDANGWTTGEAKITRVEFLDQSGGQNPVLIGGDKVRLKVFVEVLKDFSQPIIGFIVKDRLGQDLFGENTLPFTAFNSCAVEKGEVLEAEFEFILPMLPNGQYSIMTSFADGDLYDNVQHHWLHDAVILNVSSSKVRWGLVGVNFKKVSLVTKS